jgi:hypothetical protein
VSNATIASYAHTIARLSGCDVAALAGLDVMDLDVLYFGILSDDAPASFRSTVDYVETYALETYRFNGALTDAERAYVDLLLARRANAARHAA